MNLAHDEVEPILCVGESLSERDENRVEEVLERQLRKGLGCAGAGRV